MHQQQQQQHHPMMLNPSPTQPPPSASISTEMIQKCLDENKTLIMAILDNQNLGKLSECAQYQARLQHNLMYLAAIADAQPQIPAPRPQVHPNAALHQGVNHMVPQQNFPPSSSQPPNPQQVPEQMPQHQLNHPQMLPSQSHMGMVAANNGVHGMHGEGALGRGTGVFLDSSSLEGHVNLPAEQKGGDAENS